MTSTTVLERPANPVTGPNVELGCLFCSSPLDSLPFFTLFKQDRGPGKGDGLGFALNEDLVRAVFGLRVEEIQRVFLDQHDRCPRIAEVMTELGITFEEEDDYRNHEYYFHVRTLKALGRSLADILFQYTDEQRCVPVRTHIVLTRQNDRSEHQGIFRGTDCPALAACTHPARPLRRASFAG